MVIIKRLMFIKKKFEKIIPPSISTSIYTTFLYLPFSKHPF